MNSINWRLNISNDYYDDDDLLKQNQIILNANFYISFIETTDKSNMIKFIIRSFIDRFMTFQDLRLTFPFVILRFEHRVSHS